MANLRISRKIAEKFEDHILNKTNKFDTVIIENSSNFKQKDITFHMFNKTYEYYERQEKAYGVYNIIKYATLQNKKIWITIEFEENYYEPPGNYAKFIISEEKPESILKKISNA